MFKEYWFESDDGLKLFARDYQNDAPAATIVCLPGLTRNSSDYSRLSEYLSKNYRVIALDLRGRGKSQYDPDPSNYHPATYVGDVLNLLDSLDLDSVILVGTSLGGLMSMMLACMTPSKVVGLVINDIGPEINPEGLERIKGYVGEVEPVRDWHEAVAWTKGVHGNEYPEFSEHDWLAFAKNLFLENDEGQLQLAYDPNIAVLVKQMGTTAERPDMWPVFNSLLPFPLLLLRGELSDILTTDCVEQMQKIKPDMQFTEVEGCGHAPLLTEPVAIAALDQFLQSVVD